MNILTTEQIKKINKTALADKHNSTQGYVSMILSGERRAKSKLAQEILKDAHSIIKVLEGEPVKQD